MDARAQQAREHHRRVLEHEARAEDSREQRNRLIRALRDEDPARWSYAALAAAVGCTKETIAAVVQRRTR